MEPEPRAMIFDLYRGTTHDGPGLRSTVFFKGCPLACRWCHNPEGIAFTQRVWWEARKCIGCLSCRAACPTGANRPREEGVFIDDASCVRCGACVSACPSRALSFVAREWRLSELMREVLKDRHYYGQFGGGVTASGGEALAQHSFVAAFFRELRREGVHTALDTSGYAPREALEAVLPFTDCVLYDVKLLDDGRHRRLTGKSNRLILQNLELLGGEIRSGRARCELWIRTPLIPGATADAENLSAIGAYLAETLGDAVSRWELCAFNNACIGKYRRLGLPWEYEGIPLLGREEAARLREAALSAGFSESRLAVTGILASGGA